MTAAFRTSIRTGLLVLCAAPAFAQGVTFRLTNQLDLAALGASAPGSVAAYGDHLYVGGLFSGGRLFHIPNPLGTPAPAISFGGLADPATNGGLAGPGLTTNGYTNLFTDGTTLIAATNNGGVVPDIAQAYRFGTTTLAWGGNSGPASLNTQTGQLDGAGVDPVSGLVMTVAFAGDAQNFFDASTGGPVTVPAANILYYPGVGTGWRDVSYDHATGDIYLRATGGVARGQRVATGRFVGLDGTTAGVQTILDGVNNPERSAINVEYLPAGFAGQGLVILNDRDAAGPGSAFADVVKTYSATPPSAGGIWTDTPVPVSFVLADGVTPFTTANANSGIYDFSYNPVVNRLFVSDYSTSRVHVFGGPSVDITIDVPSGTQTQAEAGYPTLSGTLPVFKTGAGTLVLEAINSLAGMLFVHDGSVSAANVEALGTASLNVSAGATFAISPSLPAASAVRVADLGTITGRIDVGNGRLDIGVGGVTEAELRDHLLAGRGTGSFSGSSGIVTTGGVAGAATNPVVGYRMFASGSASVAWAAFGDSNLDGRVSQPDINLIVSGGKFGQGAATGATWVQGDANYSGGVTQADINLLVGAGLFGQGSYLPPAAAGLDAGGTIAAVPEPGIGWLAVGLGAAAALRSRGGATRDRRRLPRA